MTSYNKNLILTESSTEPSSTEGLVYIDNGTNCDIALDKIRWYNGSAWNQGARKEVAIVKESKAYNVDGGDSTGVAEQTRVLDTIVNSQSWLSLPGSNVFRVDGATYPGYYSFEFYTTFYRTSRTSCWIYDGTTKLDYSTSGYPAAVAQGIVVGNYHVNLSSLKNYTLVMEGLSTRLTNGLGVFHSHSTVGNNTYSMVIIERTF